MKERIKKVMESQHMTQQVFAQFLEISPASLSSIFNDRTKPTLQIVEAIKRKIPPAIIFFIVPPEKVNKNICFFWLSHLLLKSTYRFSVFYSKSLLKFILKL